MVYTKQVHYINNRQKEHPGPNGCSFEANVIQQNLISIFPQLLRENPDKLQNSYDFIEFSVFGFFH